MNDLNKQISQLQEKITKLEQENQFLKRLLDTSNISYALVKPQPIIKQTTLPNDKIANYFFRKFWGRQDVYALRYTNKTTGKTGYYPQCKNFWKDGCFRKNKDKRTCKECPLQSYKTLTKEVVLNHLLGKDINGNDVLGIYPMLKDSQCHFLVFDFDDHDSSFQREHRLSYQEEVDALRKICDTLGIDSLVERSRSGQGAHVWIFFTEPIPAKIARQFGFALLNKGAQSVNLKSFHYYDRMIPTQDSLPAGALGNIIALPLQGQALKEGNSAFVDENWNAYKDQFQVLWDIKSFSREEIENYIRLWDNSGPIVKEGGLPWENRSAFCKEDVNGNVSITLSNLTYIHTTNLQPRIQNQIRFLASFKNPTFFKNQAMGLSNFKESRFIYLGQDENDYIGIPRGLTETLLEKLKSSGISYTLQDKRNEGKKIHATFKGELRREQDSAIKTMLKHETGILSAATAFGKTVACCKIIAERKVNTLILLESSTLIDQWKKAIETFLDIDETPPTYKTKGNRIRTRKSVIGTLQGSHDSLTQIIDIAMVGTIYKKGNFHPNLKQYGQVILDECHHAASHTIVEILKEVDAKYVFGVTATPFRADGKEKINQFLLGPIRHRYTTKDRAQKQGIRHLIYPRFTRTVAPHHASKKMHPNDAYELVRYNRVRDTQIINDIQECIKCGRTPLVLTKFTDHAQTLWKALQNVADHVILMTGQLNKKEKEKIRNQLQTIKNNETLILVATGQLVGEGFDYPRLDTLFLATPISFSSVVEQYAGRLHRDFDGKKDVIIYDYIDSHVPMLNAMYLKRLKTYKKMGYEVVSGITNKHLETNAIFDIDNYKDVFWQDIQNANKEIIISSPKLDTRKVHGFIENLKHILDKDLKVTIVTLHPNSYTYKDSNDSMNLIQQLKAQGYNVETAKRLYERYAIIDHELVWYGSMNFLSKEDIEDNLMRIQNHEIATELLELTFGKKSLQIPLL